MIVLNDASVRWSSEKRAAQWLQAPTDGWSHPGVAIANCHVAEAVDSWTQQVDFVVFTPYAVIVLEVKGTHPDIVDGRIIAEPNGCWRHDLTVLEPVRTRASDTNPLGQVLDAAYRLKSWTAKHNPDHAFVHAAVVLVPPTYSSVTLRPSAMPRGTAVVLGETGLHAVVDGSSRARPIWSAEQVYSMLNALSLGSLISIPELVDEGFFPLAATHTTWAPPQRSPSPTAHRPHRTTGIPPSPRRSPPSHTATFPGLGHRLSPHSARRRQQTIAVAIIATFFIAVVWLVAHLPPTHHRAPHPSPPTTPTLTTRQPTS